MGAQFTPAATFKAFGKEHPIPDLLKGVLKDEASQKTVLEMLGKAHAMEQYKGRIEAAVQERDQYRAQIQQIQTELIPQVRDLNQALEKNDLYSVFEQLKISDAMVFEWCQKRIAELEMPETQRRALEDNRRFSREKLIQQRDSQSRMSAMEEQQGMSGLEELNMTLELDPEVRQIAQAMDAKFGEGSFAQKVIQQGIFLEQRGQVHRPMALARQVAKEYAGFFPANPPAQATTQAPPPQTAAPAPNQGERGGKAPKTLPNLNNTTSSPAKKKFQSLDEMRQYAQTLQD